MPPLGQQRQSFLKMKSKKLLSTHCQLWLAPFGLPLSLLLLVLWVEGESPGPHEGLGYGQGALKLVSGMVGYWTFCPNSWSSGC